MVEWLRNLNLFALPVLGEEGVCLLELAEDFRLVECGHALGAGHVLVRGAGGCGAGGSESG